MMRIKRLPLCVTASLVLVTSSCGTDRAGSSQPAPAGSPSHAARPASEAPAPAAASTDLDNPTPLPAKEIKGTGSKKTLTYYYTFNANPGVITMTAIARNAHSAYTQALAFGLQDLTAHKLCGASSGNTPTEKTMTVTCQVDKAQPLILRLDLAEETIDYSVRLDGPVELPSPETTVVKSTAGVGSTDIDEPTRLSTNRIKGQGAKRPVSYYYSFNAGPGELTLIVDGKNQHAALTNALTAGVYTLRAERLCEVSLGNTTLDARQVIKCKVDTRQPVILRLDLSAETIDFAARFEGPFDFKDFTPPQEVTIALDAAVLFDTARAVLKPEARQTLHEAAERVKKFADAPVAISGHTDNVGSETNNQTLSENRAGAVQQYFTSQEGISANRLTAKGYGESQPIADNTTEEGRARNRRVEVVISPRSR